MARATGERTPVRIRRGVWRTIAGRASSPTTAAGTGADGAASTGADPALQQYGAEWFP